MKALVCVADDDCRVSFNQTIHYYELRQTNAEWNIVFIHGTPATAAVFGEQQEVPEEIFRGLEVAQPSAMENSPLQPSLWMTAPFIALLAAIALAPLFFADWWGKHYPKVCGGLAATLVAFL